MLLFDLKYVFLNVINFMCKQAWKFEQQRCLAGLLHIAAGLPYAAILVLQSKSVMIRRPKK